MSHNFENRLKRMAGVSTQKSNPIESQVQGNKKLFYGRLIPMLSPSPCCSCFKWRKFFQYCVDWWCPRRCCCFNCCFCFLSRKASLNDYYTCALICCTVAFWKDPSEINFSTGSCTLKMVNQYAVSRNMWLNPSSASI